MHGQNHIKFKTCNFKSESCIDNLLDFEPVTFSSGRLEASLFYRYSDSRLVDGTKATPCPCHCM